MSSIINISLLFIILIFSGCEEKMKPVVTISPKLQLPIKCMGLSSINIDKNILTLFKDLYKFDESCPFGLSISYKKDIVCNSRHNIQMKSVSRFPKSYLKLEVRRGIDMQYTYYKDLYNNVDEDDMIEGFRRLREDLL